MARPPRYTADALLDVALALLVTRGVRAVSAAAVAAEAGVPSGSLYHRFASRDVLLAALWLRTVEAFQVQFGERLRGPHTLAAARDAAVSVLTWTRAHPAEAQLLLRYRLSDLLDGGLPPEQTRHARSLQRAAEEGLRAFATRLGLAEERVRFALVHVPYAAARASLTRGVVPPASLDALVDETVVALLGGARRPRPSGGARPLRPDSARPARDPQRSDSAQPARTPQRSDSAQLARTPQRRDSPPPTRTAQRHDSPQPARTPQRPGVTRPARAPQRPRRTRPRKPAGR